MDAAPTQHTLWVVRDLKFSQEGKHEYAIRGPDQPKSHGVNHVRRQRVQRKGWFAFGELTEVTAAGHSHFWQPNQTYSAIDRIFVGSPSWMFLRLQGDARVVGDLANLVARRVSDHAAVSARIFFEHRGRRQSTIPPFVCKRKLFPEAVAELERQCELHLLSGVERLQTHKLILRVAAGITLREPFLSVKVAAATGESASWIRNSALSHISQVVWENYTQRAKVLLQRYDFAKRFMQVDRCSGHVLLRDPIAFARTFDAARLEIQ